MNEQEIRKNWKVIENSDQERPGYAFRDYLAIEVIVEILHNQSGIIHQYIFSEMMQVGENHPSIFNWKENNYSCDCNRHLFFHRAIGQEPEDDDEDDECTDYKYSVRLINPVDGKAYYDEFPFLSLLK